MIGQALPTAAAAPQVAPHRAILASPSCGAGDGVGYVGMLLARALSDLTSNSPEIVSLGGGQDGPLSVRSRVRFASRMFAAHLGPTSSFVIYNHVGLARVHRWLPFRARMPYAVFVHGIEAWDPLLTAERTGALRDATLRIANSAYTAGRLQAVHPDIGVVTACPLALLDSSDMPADQPDAALLSRIRDVNVLILGRMTSGERYKGHDELLEAWPFVRSAVPGAQLVIAGTGDDLQRLRCKASALGIESDVLFCGRVSEATKRALLKLTKLFAMPSRGEGFGIVYLEAMRAARACLGCAEDGASAVILDGTTGILMPDAAPQRLGTEISALLRDDQRCRKLGAAGERRFRTEFTFTHFRNRLGAILQGALQIPTGRVA